MKLENIPALSLPFPPQEIEWRVGSTNSDKTKGLALAYLTARHVMDRLDTVCGPENWQDRYEFHGSRTVCYLSLRIGGEWITKADGAGDSDVEAEKGAISDALKRAAVKWGIGRYLYLLGNAWVTIEAAGKSYKIANAEYGRLEKMLAERFGTDAPLSEMQPTSAPAFAEPDTKAKSRENFTVIMDALRTAGNKGKAQFREFWTGANFLEVFEIMPEDWKSELIAEKDAFLASYGGVKAKVDPNESLDQMFKETVPK